MTAISYKSISKITFFIMYMEKTQIIAKQIDEIHSEWRMTNIWFS